MKAVCQLFLAQSQLISNFSNHQRDTYIRGLGSTQRTFFPFRGLAPGIAKFRSNRAASQPERASFAIFRSASSVSPSVTQPGRSGNSAQYPPSSALCILRGYLIFISTHPVFGVPPTFLSSGLSSRVPGPKSSWFLSRGCDGNPLSGLTPILSSSAI